MLQEPESETDNNLDNIINQLEEKFKDNKDLLNKYKKYIPLLNDKTKKIIDLEEIYEDLGYCQKGNAKTMVVNSFKKEDYISEKKNLTHTKGGLKDYIFISMDVFLKILKRPRCIKAKIINNIITTADKIITDSSSSSSSNDILVNNNAYSNITDDRLLQLLKENFTIDEQNLFVNQFILYLYYGNDENNFIINLDYIWKKWLGFDRKDSAKRLLEKNFILDKDYIIKKDDNLSFTKMYDFMIENNVFETLHPKEEQLKNVYNNEIILLNVDTFKGLCMLANTTEAKQIRKYYSKVEKIMNIRMKELLQENNLLQENKKKSIKDEIQYTSNISTIQIPSTPLTDFNKSGIYFVIYGKKLIYDLTNVPENALIIGFGSSKNGYERIKQHKKETGEETRVLDFISTPHYEYFEREFDKTLQSENKIVKAKLIENKYIKREQFYIISKEDYDNKIEYLKSIINSKQQDKTIQLKELELQLEQETTKQQQETTKQQQETTKQQQETTKQLQLQFEILKYKSIIREI